MVRHRLPIFCFLLQCCCVKLVFAKDFVDGTSNFLPLPNDSASPALPWIQRGNAFAQGYKVPLALAKQCVPSEFKVVETLPGSGFTSGALYIAKYDNRSSIAYSELIFQCATVEYRGHKASWIAAIFVDNVIAQQAGIEVWGLPKKLATFQWGQDPSSGMEHVVVTDQHGVTVLDASFRDRSPTIPAMQQTVHTFGIVNQSTVLLSDTKQKYGVKPILRNNVYNVSSQSPLHEYMAGSKATAEKVEMSDGLFNMTAPIALPPSTHT